MAAQEPTRSLLERARGGDREAFGEIAERFRPRLANQIEARLGPALRAVLEVEDVLGETFACALESIERFQWRDEETFYRWLGSIAEHVIRNASRKQGWSQLALDRDVAAAGASPSADLRRGERFDRLEAALNRLSPDHRRALVLARLEGLTIEEISRRMDRSRDAVKKLLARALHELRRYFGDTESFHLPDRRLDGGGAGSDVPRVP
jgi:RNA polymerase sigma-70 factor (ECF subfamily)